ncbi:MAG: DNA internalization-related competence protein ComEC/Rec2 [Ignavibacterium sp.]|nr:DNA internalization-related competence protein ComEC/Rec2 [Ignavibacterium sp.]
MIAPIIIIADSIFVLIILISLVILLLCLFFLKDKLFISKNIIAYLLVIISSIFITQIRNEPFDSALLKYYKEKDVTVFGRVESIELKREFEIVLTLITDSVIIAGNIYSDPEKILFKFRGDTVEREKFYENIMPGNSIYAHGIFLKGREKRNPGEFDYNRYLKSKDISGILISNEGDSINIISSEKDFISSIIFSARKSVDERLNKLFEPETAGLLRGLLLADRSEIDFELKTQFINSGVIHVLAVSGLHVGYILLIFLFVFGRFNLYLRTFFIAAGLLSFMFITGMPPSVFRATVMALVILFAFLSNRSTNLLNSISLAAIIILLVDPNEIYNPGFQLSFSAVLAIGIIYPIIEKEINRLKISNKFIRGIILFSGVSLSAQIGTLPFTLAYFGKLSVVALFANLIVIPLIGVVIGLAFSSLFISVISLTIASYFAVVNDLIVKLLFSLISFTGDLQYSFIWIPDYSLADAIIFYAVIALFIYIIKDAIRWQPKLIITILAITNIIYLSSIDDIELLPDNQLSIMMVDVGQGDAILVKFPNNQTALIDAGDLNPFFDNGERILIPLLRYLGIKKVDYGFITHLDADHYGGFLSLLYNGLIDEIFKPSPDTTLKDIRLERFLTNLNVNVNYYTREIYELGGAKLYILNDDKDDFYNALSSNDKSGMMKLVYGDVSILFTGDVERKAEIYYADRYGQFLDVDVLKVAHHGSKTSSIPEFLEIATPEISLVSAGIKNKFKHPSEEIIERLEYFGSDIYRTDQSGALLFYSDGNNINKIDWRNF